MSRQDIIIQIRKSSYTKRNVIGFGVDWEYILIDEFLSISQVLDHAMYFNLFMVLCMYATCCRDLNHQLSSIG